MKSQPSTSVIIPCWNAQDFVGQAIQTVLDQKGLDVEILVVDDGSTDSTEHVVKAFGSKVTLIAQRHRGAAAARNVGLKAALGTFALFLDADDYLEPNSLAAWAAGLASADILLAPFVLETGKSRRKGQGPGPLATTQSLLNDWLSGHYTPPCSVLWRTSFLRSIGGWNESLLRNQDGELAMRAIIMGARVALTDKGCGVYVQHDTPGRISKRKGRATRSCEYEILAALQNLAQARGVEGCDVGFASAYYTVARDAFSDGIDDIGEQALRRAREFGLTGHIGTAAHQISSNVMGLRLKQRLTAHVKSVSSFVIGRKRRRR